MSTAVGKLSSLPPSWPKSGGKAERLKAERLKGLQLHRFPHYHFGSPNRIFAISDCVGRAETKGSRSRSCILHFAAAAGISWMCMINLCAMHYISLLNKPGNLGGPRPIGAPFRAASRKWWQLVWSAGQIFIYIVSGISPFYFCFPSAAGNS